MAAMVDEYTKIGGATSITIKGALSAGGGVGTAAVNVGAKLGSLNIDGAVTGAAIQVGRDLGKLTIGARWTTRSSRRKGSEADQQDRHGDRRRHRKGSV
jgi:hypothetical protein